MKTKTKTLSENQELKDLLKNNNFRNNQNYIINLKEKNKVIQYAYTKNKKSYNLLNINTNFRLNNRLSIGEIGYIKKGFNYKFNINYIFFYLFPLIFFVQPINMIINGGTIYETTTTMGKTTHQTIILDNLGLLERFYEVKFFFIVPIIFIIIRLFIYYRNKSFYGNHLIFINNIDSDKFFLYRFTK